MDRNDGSRELTNYGGPNAEGKENGVQAQPVGREKTRKNKRILRSMAKTAVIAALYVTLVFVFFPISFSNIQFRVAEALAVLAFFFPEAIPGLFLGCLLANIANGPADMILGSLATLASSSITYSLRKLPVIFGLLPPIVINAFVVPVVLLTMPDITTGYWVNALLVFLGQSAVLLTLGLLLYSRIKKMRGSKLLK